jgi:hypothetical protein
MQLVALAAQVIQTEPRLLLVNVMTVAAVQAVTVAS